MLKVVIVDDEQIIRNGMKTIIDWESHGFCIVGEADNGISGIELISEERPDIALVDVKMPEMTGIEMIAALKEGNVKTKFIILSGYSDFAYTKKAILLGVDAYLLKPLDEDELIQMLNSIREKIEEENILEDYFEKGKQYVLKDIIRKMIESKFENNDIPCNLAEVEACIGTPDYCVAIINAESDNNLLNGQIIDFFKNRKIFAYEDIDVVAILALKANQTSVQRVERLLQQLEGLTGIHTFAVVGPRVKRCSLLNVSFKEAREFMLNKFLYSHLCVINTEDFVTKEDTEKQTGKIKIILEKVTLAVQIMDGAYISEGIQELKDIFYSRTYSQSEIKSCCSNLLVGLLNNVSAQAESTEYISRENILQKVYSMSNLDQLMKYVEQQLNLLAEILSDMTADTMIKRVEHYVKKNYNSRLTLDILGTMFGYSSVYLGKIFKQYTGQSFNQYLDNLRIGEAKKLLAGDMKVYQIADKVGFKSNDYFCSKFKRSEKMSPMEYKRQLQENANG